MIKKRYRSNKSEGKIPHKKTYVGDVKFDSKMESEYYLYLLELKAKGIVIDIELQPEFELQPKFFIYENKKIEGSDSEYEKYNKLRLKHNKLYPDKPIKIIDGITYRSDFKVTFSDGSIKIVDPKGQKTADFRLKEKMFRFHYPHLPLECVINYKNKWISFEEYEAIQRVLKKAKKAKKEK